MKLVRAVGLTFLLFGSAAGCTLASGAADLEKGEGIPLCGECAYSSDCASANCRAVHCADGGTPSLCVPEHVTEQTDPGQVSCDWASVCP